MAQGFPARALAFGRKLRNIQRLVQSELRSPMRAPLGRRLWAYRHGFLTESAVRFGLAPENVHLYVSDVARYVRSASINGPFAFALNNKIVFSRMVASYGVDVPSYHALIERGKLRPIGTDWELREAGDVVEACRKGANFIMKPGSGGRGCSVAAVTTRDGQLHINHRPAELSALETLLSCYGNGVVCDLIRQHEYAERIFPEATNSLRVQTMWDIDRNEPFICYAGHRFGSSTSVPTDNFARGGVMALVDIETGELGPAHSGHGSDEEAWYDRHPDTGARIEGVRVAGWRSMKDRLLELCRQMSYVPYVGWDVVVTDDGFVVLEGNSYADLVFQFFFPLLEDERVRRFYEHYGVIAPAAERESGR